MVRGEGRGGGEGRRGGGEGGEGGEGGGEGFGRSVDVFAHCIELQSLSLCCHVTGAL